jgi:hypothetical protein
MNRAPQMNTPEYRKLYLANLKLEVANNNKNLVANKGSPSVNQYIQNTGQPILGVPTFKGETNIQSKGIKWKGFK